MANRFEKKKVLITVMTYLIPSRSYIETVCTAGITEDGEWIRLYPIDYRYLDQAKQFHKYQWIEIELGPKGNEKDKRLESRRPRVESIKLLGEPLTTKLNWKPNQEMALKQFRLFGQQPKPLTKIPFKFSYVFKCRDNEMPHNAMIEDWELGVLFLKETYRLGSEQEAAESVKHKYFNELCSSKRDTRLFMGTTFPYNSWVVLGVFYPKSDPDHPKQLPLF